MEETAAPQPAVRAIVRELNELIAERDLVLSLVDAEEERQADLSTAAEEKDRERIDALTDARLNGWEIDLQLADGFATAAEALRRQVKESSAVADRLRERVGPLNGEISALRQAVETQLTAFIDDLYEKQIAQYNEQARELAKTVLKIAAIVRVMLDRRAGNSNGWSGEIFLPGMEARRGTYIPPLLDGASQEFDRAANQRVADIWELVEAAGFHL